MSMHLRTNGCSTNTLVDLLHLGGLISCTLDFLKRGQVIVVAQALVIVVDAEAELDHAVDAAGELGRLIQVEAGGEERSVEEQPDQVLHRLVRLICSSLPSGVGCTSRGGFHPFQTKGST